MEMEMEMDELGKIDAEDLPAAFRTRTKIAASTTSSFESFLDVDLSVQRIDDIKHHLWLVGRPYLPRPLNIQIVLGRTIVPTSDASLHLVWTSSRIFVKPLPRYMLSQAFYQRHLSPPHPHGPALGLLHSYLALVPTELDFVLAHETHLLPHSLEWKDWRALARRLLDHYPGDTIRDHLPARYGYGELRLGRLDKIYRIRQGEWLHGYSTSTGHPSYEAFFAENLGTFAAATVYIIVVLTALQLGLTTERLDDNHTFQNVCYGFAIFAIVSPIAALGSVMAISLVAFFAHWSRTVVAQRAGRGIEAA
ncbi:N-acetylglucosaminyldiphosphodolichol N-acetylglucosaminyltransferase catalytic subunit alg13 [Elasticomyces elasticus]|nr:N-acetylglucosaminyldiphosphodolichol N-acetylglucosaminyltransferase catalytic subunit alg13 [Elasticomyces elasticus]